MREKEVEREEEKNARIYKVRKNSQMEIIEVKIDRWLDFLTIFHWENFSYSIFEFAPLNSFLLNFNDEI